MAKFYMFYGAQVYEFERPAIVAKPERWVFSNQHRSGIGIRRDKYGI